MTLTKERYYRALNDKRIAEETLKFMLSDRVTLKGDEVELFNTMLTGIREQIMRQNRLIRKFK